MLILFVLLQNLGSTYKFQSQSLYILVKEEPRDLAALLSACTVFFSKMNTIPIPCMPVHKENTYANSTFSQKSSCRFNNKEELSSTLKVSKRLLNLEMIAFSSLHSKTYQSILRSILHSQSKVSSLMITKCFLFRFRYGEMSTPLATLEIQQLSFSARILCLPSSQRILLIFCTLPPNSQEYDSWLVVFQKTISKNLYFFT